MPRFRGRDRGVESPGRDDQSQRPGGGQRPGQANRQLLPAAAVPLQRPVVQPVRRLRFDRVDRPVGQHVGFEREDGALAGAEVGRHAAAHLALAQEGRRGADGLHLAWDVAQGKHRFRHRPRRPRSPVARPRKSSRAATPVCRHPWVSRCSMHSGDGTERRIVLDRQTTPAKTIRGSFHDSGRRRAGQSLAAAISPRLSAATAGVRSLLAGACRRDLPTTFQASGTSPVETSTNSREGSRSNVTFRNGSRWASIFSLTDSSTPRSEKS